ESERLWLQLPHYRSCYLERLAQPHLRLRIAKFGSGSSHFAGEGSRGAGAGHRDSRPPIGTRPGTHSASSSRSRRGCASRKHLRRNSNSGLAGREKTGNRNCPATTSATRRRSKGKGVVSCRRENRLSRRHAGFGSGSRSRLGRGYGEAGGG